VSDRDQDEGTYLRKQTSCSTGGLHETTVTVPELERALLQELDASHGTSKRALWRLAWLHSETGRYEKALKYVGTLAGLSTNLEEGRLRVFRFGDILGPRGAGATRFLVRLLVGVAAESQRRLQ
jgi:hypothetical protein